jgi:uncharacterized protein (TIGR02611 family)
MAVVDRDTVPSEARDPATVSSRFGLLDRIRATTAGRITLKVVVAVVGVAILLLGIMMIPLPGPGWLVVFAGLAILSIEYVWAKHLLRFVRERVKTWTQWVRQQPFMVRIGIGGVGLVGLAVLAWLALRSDLGGQVAADLWRFLTSN